MEDNAKQIALAVLISLLKQTKKIDYFSSLATITAIAILIGTVFFIQSNILRAISLIIFVLGFIEKYYAIRVSFDKELFEYLTLYSDVDLPKVLLKLDASFLGFGLIKKNNEIRSLESRQKGTISLLRKQALCCSMQMLLFIIIPFIA